MDSRQVIAAIFLSLLCTALLVLFFDHKGPWKSIWSIFLIILLGVWATAVWLDPIGPVYWGIAWIPLIFVALLLTMALVAATPSTEKKRKLRDRLMNIALVQDEKEKRIFTKNIFFWSLLLFLVVCIVIGYLVDH